jgi:hypothetical protein
MGLSELSQQAEVGAVQGMALLLLLRMDRNSGSHPYATTGPAARRGLVGIDGPSHRDDALCPKSSTSFSNPRAGNMREAKRAEHDQGDDSDSGFWGVGAQP